MTEPHELTAANVARAIRDGSLTSSSLITTLIERHGVFDEALQAWEMFDGEGATRSSMSALTDGPSQPLPLNGVPFAAKDIFDVEKLPTGAGSPIYRDRVAQRDSTVVSRLRAAGAIPLGKTVTTEFAFLKPSRTINPWNRLATPGGSSSGSAVAVASRMVPFALGSQTAGSTLRPAAYNGVVGFKPTYGRISRAGVFPLAWTLDTIGIICRSVEDAALVLQQVAGADPLDSLSANEAVGEYVGELADAATHPPTIGVLQDQFVFSRSSGEVGVHVQEKIDRLQQSGATVIDVRLEADIEQAMEAHVTVMATEAAAIHRTTLANHASDYSDVMREFVERGSEILGADYLDAQRLRLRFSRAVDALFDRCDVVLTPSTPTPAPRSLETTGDPSFQTPWTFSGVPAISIPTGLSEDGLPFGIQLIGPRFVEGALLRAAAWCERVLDVKLEPDLARFVS